MRLIIFIPIFCINGLAWTFVSAQDTLLNMQNKKILVKVIEVGPQDIKYKAANNPDGPLIIIPRKEVSQITYQNGTIEKFSKKEPVSKIIKEKTDARRNDFGRNYIYLTLTDLYMGMLSGGYERFSKKGNLSYKAHLSFGLINMRAREHVYVVAELDEINDGGYFYPDKIFSSSIDVNYFPAAQGTFRYFIGPSIEYGQFYEKNYMHYPNAPNSLYIQKVRRGYIATLIKNGLMYQPTKNFCFTVFLGGGAYLSDSNRNAFPYNFILFELGINAGYRF